MNSRQLNALRSSLPPFAEGPPAGDGFRQYLDYYRLDFAERYPRVVHRAGLIPAGSYQLMTQRWRLPRARANLLILHGYFDHTGIYDKAIDYGLSRDCNVTIFDLPGHGLSSGAPAAIDDFRDYGEAVAAVLATAAPPGLPLLVLGQSTGCAALVEFARHHPWPFQRAALLAPLVRPAGWRGVRLGYQLLHPFTDGVARKFNSNSSDRGFLDFVRRDPLQCRRVSLRWIGALKRWLAALPLEDLGAGPALVLQGRGDGTVAWRYNMRAIAKLFPGSEIHYLPGAGHQLVNESAEIRRAYYRILDDYFFAAPPP